MIAQREVPSRCTRIAVVDREKSILVWRWRHRAVRIERSASHVREFQIRQDGLCTAGEAGKPQRLSNRDRSEKAVIFPHGQRVPWPKISKVASSYARERLEIFPPARRWTGGSPPDAKSKAA